MSAVVITGAASGIGRATALSVAREGRAVALWDLNEDGVAATARDCAALGVATTTGAFDVAEATARAEHLDAARALGPLGGLVHAAGMAGMTPISTLDLSIWSRALDVHLTVAAALTHEMHGDLAESGDGSIVYLSSIEGFFGHPWLPAYCAAKAGLLGLARSAAAELGFIGVRVNCVCPGAIETPLLAPYLELEGRRDNLVGRTPLGRLGAPEDIADVISFLLSDKARFVTGASLVVDGGMTAVGGI